MLSLLTLLGGALMVAGCGAGALAAAGAEAEPDSEVHSEAGSDSEAETEDRATAGAEVEEQTSPCAAALTTPRASSPRLEEAARELFDIDCAQLGQGAWRLVFRSLEELPPSAETLEDDAGASNSIVGTWALAYVTNDHRVTIGEPLALRLENNQFYEVTQVRVVENFDFDGDRHAELALWIGTARFEETPTGAVHVFTYREGRIEPYAHATLRVRIDGVRDADGDGRPDLVSRQPYFVMTPFGIDGIPAGGPWHVHRSMPDGTFSDRDEVALRLLRDACPSPPARILSRFVGVQDAYEEGARAVSCARIWGRAADAVADQVREDIAALCRSETHYTCEELSQTLTSHARSLDPPQRLR